MRKDRIWPTAIISVLVLYVAFGLIAARIATHDPNFAVEPDYYNKAVMWDSSLAQSHRSDALRWRLIPTLSPVGQSTPAILAFDVRDSSGEIVKGAHVSVEARQVAYAENVTSATLDERGDGDYAAKLPLVRPGLWEFRVVATRGSDRFATTLRMDASTTTDARVVEDRPGEASAASLRAGSRREENRLDVRPRTQ